MAMPFLSVATEEEAERLIVLHCPLGYDGEYRIPVSWAKGDIATALAHARDHFQGGRHDVL